MNFKTLLTPRSKRYPRIMMSEHSGSIYIMSGKTQGTKLVQGESGLNKHIQVGAHREDWGSSGMIDYKGKVVFDCEA